MTALDFIKSGLDKIAKQFPLVEIRYSYDYGINTHIIQFDPIDAYYNLPELDAVWIPFSLEFDETFADESIAFIGSDSILSITDNFELSWNIQMIDITFEGFRELLADSDFGMSINSLPETVIWNPTVPNYNNYVINQTEFNFSVDSMSHFLFENSILVPKVKVQDASADLNENEKYAMAA